MDIARQWFTQPWKIRGGTKTLWYARYEAVREAEIKKMHKIKTDIDKAGK